jgi:hypothetical protein
MIALTQAVTIVMIEDDDGHARLCVQRRLACSAGVKPAGVRVRTP